MNRVQLHFTDYYNVDPAKLRAHGAFNVSLINDLPLFIDPFLLFSSDRPEYKQLHEDILHYLRFLRVKATNRELSPGELESWFMFHEVPENWLGFSKQGNQGHGLGRGFAAALATNLDGVFKDFGAEGVTKSSHLEKLALIDEGVGKDGISDFTTNLIKGYLLDYTQEFAVDHLSTSDRDEFHIAKVRFDYDLESWVSGKYELPVLGDDFVLLTPRDILTRNDIWISRQGYVDNLRDVIHSVSNGELRTRLNTYLAKALPDEPTREDFSEAASSLARQFPEILDYFIRRREDTGDQAVERSQEWVRKTSDLFVKQLRSFVDLLAAETQFFSVGYQTESETMDRVLFLKDVVENKGGHRLFYVDGEPIRREEDLQILYRMTWYGTASDVSREVNDGRGPADFKISRGASDKTIVEFKLASNTQLARNLKNQASIYQKASDANWSIKVIFYFTQQELDRVKKTLKDLDLQDDPNVILVDARSDNKPSGSKA